MNLPQKRGLEPTSYERAVGTGAQRTSSPESMPRGGSPYDTACVLAKRSQGHGLTSNQTLTRLKEQARRGGRLAASAAAAGEVAGIAPVPLCCCYCHFELEVVVHDARESTPDDAQPVD